MGGDGDGDGELLSAQPSAELVFPFKLGKQISCTLKLVNSTKSSVAFKVKTTSPKKYSVRPNTGVILPTSTLDVAVTMQPQHEIPSDAQSKDKFLIQSVVAPNGFTSGDVSQEMFLKDSGNDIYEIKLKVAYEFSESNGKLQEEEGAKDSGDIKAKIQEMNAAMTTVSEERNAAVALSQRLQQELSTLTANRSKLEVRQVGFSFLVVFLVGLFGILLGFLLSS